MAREAGREGSRDEVEEEDKKGVLEAWPGATTCRCDPPSPAAAFPRCRLASVKSFLTGFGATFFSMFDVPVFW